MDQLPEDTLVMVMSQLSEADVIACRLTCTRLADVALNPLVWRHRAIRDDDPLACTVLRLAPCLDELRATVPSERCHHPFAATCAVRELSLRVEPGGAVQAALLVSQQEALGRLRAVRLQCSNVGEAVAHGDDAAMLLGALVSTTGLESLSLVGDGTNIQIKRSFLLRGPVTPSLKSFACFLTWDTETFCNFILAGHGATLEAVDFTSSPPVLSCSPPSSPVSMLAALPKLRKLSCHLVPGLEDVAACESLRELKLTVTPDLGDNAENAPGAAALLRRADQLRFVHLYFPAAYNHGNVGAQLTRALAKSGKSQLETLFFEVDGIYFLGYSPRKALLRALPSLPALRRLRVRMKPDELLAGITPNVAPSLQSLQLLPHDDQLELTPMCPHALLHSDKVRTLLSVNPSLHLELHHFTSCSVCKVCKLNCHKGPLRGDKVTGIFAHPEGECPSPEDHPTDRPWIHISDLTLP